MMVPYTDEHGLRAYRATATWRDVVTAVQRRPGRRYPVWALWLAFVAGLLGGAIRW